MTRRLGSSIQAGWHVRTFSIGPIEMMQVDLKGTKTIGVLRAVANRSTGTPRLLKLEVYEPTEEYVMNLLPPGPAIKPDRLQGIGNVYVVPFSRVAASEASVLPAYYKKKFNLDVQVLPTIQSLPGSFDVKRNQVSAEWLWASIRKSYPDVTDDPQNLIIGVTDADIYAREFNWDFTFNYRDGRLAVISLARLNPSFFHLEPDPEIVSQRFRKVTTKIIGLLHYNMQPGSGGFSVLGSQASTDEIDRLGEDILASDQPENEGDPALIATFRQGKGYRWPATVDQYSFQHINDSTRGIIQLEMDLGRLYVRENDFLLPNNPPIELSRVYNSTDKGIHSFGIGATDNYDSSIFSSDHLATVGVVNEMGWEATLIRTSPGRTLSSDSHYVNQDSGGKLGGGDLYWKDSKFFMTLPRGQLYTFQTCEEGGPPCYLIGYRNGQGDELKLQRDKKGQIVNMTASAADGSHQANPVLRYTYDDKSSIVDIKSVNGEEVKYAYDGKERLVRVEHSNGELTEYAYDENSRMTGVRSNGTVIAIFAYDEKGRANALQLWDGTLYRISYIADETGSVLEADLTGSDGTNQRIYPKRMQDSSANMVASFNRR